MTIRAGKDQGGFLKRGHLGCLKGAWISTRQGLRGPDPFQVERTAGADAKAGNSGIHPLLGPNPGEPAPCRVLGVRGAAVMSFPGATGDLGK